MRDLRDRDVTGVEEGETYATGVKPGGVSLTQALRVQRMAAPVAASAPEESAEAANDAGGHGLPMAWLIGRSAADGIDTARVRSLGRSAADGIDTARVRSLGRSAADGLRAPIQRRADGATSRDAAGAVRSTLANADTSGGRPVPEHLQERFGAAGADVSGVRLHTSDSSGRAAEAVSARAYTVGQDVHFGAGQYSPGTADGDFLIAHEVAHTLQQAGEPGAPQFDLEISQPHDPAEAEADHIATSVLAGVGQLPAIASRGAQRKLMRWIDRAGAEAVIRAMDGATPDQLDAIRVALLEGDGSADDLVPIDIPGYAGYVNRADLPGLVAQCDRRIAAAPSSSEAPEPGPLRGGAGPLVSARDAHIRLTQYVRPAEELSARVMRDVAEGRLTHMEGREAASSGRTDARMETRERLSRGGRAMSEAVEPRGATLGELADRYAMRMLSRSAELRARFGITNLVRGDAATERALTAIRDSEEVSHAIIRAAGRPNPTMTGAARVMRVAGPVMVGAQAVVGTYRVLDAEEGEHLWTAGEEISGFAGGTLGASAGGVVLSTLGAVAVGAGVVVSAPVAIVVSILVVGGMAMAGSMAGQSVWNRQVDHDSVRELEMELGRAIETFANASTGDLVAGGMGTLGRAAGGGFGGLMERDRRRVEEEMRRGPPPEETSGGEAPP